MKRVCFFGIYDPCYARTRVLEAGFVARGYDVRHCRVDPRVGKLTKYIELWQLGREARKESYEHVIVCFPGQSVVWLARLLFGKRVLFDAFLSLYDSNVFDRRLYGPYTLRAFRDRMLDTVSCMLAHRVFLDTNAHIEYFVRTFGLVREKFVRVYIGADAEIFRPHDDIPAEVFTVHFHGSFIPLQGLTYIIEAAVMLGLEDIEFRIVGSGQQYRQIRDMVAERGLSNVHLVGRVPLEEIPSHMARAHVSLGIFGDTEKTQRVIPNKVYEAMAMGKAILTADTPAIRELPGAPDAFMLVSAADASALASAIRSLKDDAGLRTRLGRNALALFKRVAEPARVVERLLEDIDA